MGNSRLKNKTVLVTGGSRGIGRAIVERFHQESATIYFTYAKNTECAEAVKEAAPGSKAFQCLGNDRQGIRKVLDVIREESGGLDVLINNAGISINSYFAMMQESDWTRVLETNLNSVYRWCAESVRIMMAAKNGSIINMASVSGLFGVPGQTAYGASKGAILAFTRALAAETAAKGIRVNALVPGFIDTEMSAKIPRPLKRKYMEKIGMQRFGKPEEIASAALFLATDESSYMTGQAIIVDGGLTSTVG